MALPNSGEASPISVPVLAGKFRLFGAGRTGPIGALAGEFRRCHPLQRRMRTRLVIVLAPDFDFASGVLERQEPVCVEAFLPKTSVEGFILRIVGRLARAREVNLHAIFVRPFVERLRNELAAVVCLDIAGKRTMLREPSQRGDNVLATQ